MQKFIKVNFIILVILCLLCSPVFAEFYIGQENIETGDSQEESEKDLDSLRLEKSEIESEIGMMCLIQYLQWLNK